MDDLYAAIRTGYEMSVSTPNLVIVYDFLGSRSLPPSFFTAVTYMRKMRQANVRARVVIAAPQFVESIYKIFQRLASDLASGFYFAQDEADALRYIAEQRSVS